MLGVAKQQQKGFRTIPLIGHTATLTALANDMDYAHIFSGQIKHLADPGDILIVISASGNSANVVHALTEAKNIGMYSIAFLGMDGGEAAAIADKKIIAPSYAYGPIEDLHMIFDHIITGYFQQ
jgi:D-sedoheptulose 7-phosphate isomerase